MSQTWERLHEPPVDWKNEWIDMITKEKESERTTVRIENERIKGTIHCEELEGTSMLEGI